MTTRKSGLLGVLLGVMALAACKEGDPPPVPEPDVTVRIVPDTATLSTTPPGNTRQFTAIVSNAANQAVTWSSSVPAVATVSPTGLVTAVAAGSTQIIAKSVQDTTARDAAAVNVMAPNAPTLTITGVTRGGTNTQVIPGNVQDHIDVIADLQRPNGAQVSRVEFLLDNQLLDGQGGRPNCTQTFTSGGSADLEVDEAVENIICSINTAAFVEATGAPAFANGNHTVSARAVQPNGNTVTTSGPQLTFNNPNFINAAVTFLPPSGRPACVSSGSNARSIGGPGTVWCTGDVRVALTPVNYGGSSQAIASATVILRTNGTGVTWEDGVCRSTNNRATDPTIASVDKGTGTGEFPGCRSITKTATDGNAADGLAVTFSSGGIGPVGVNFIEDGITFTVNTLTAGGSPGPACINPVLTVNPIATCGTGAGNASDPNELFSVTPFRLDNLPPRVLTFDLIPDICDVTTCYLNAAFTFTPRTGFYTSVDYGVDHQNAATFFQAGASATALTTVASAAALDNSATSSELLLRVSARDSLGNTALLYPTANPAIVTPNANNAQKFGVDKAAPVVAGATAPPNNGANDTLVFNITAADTATPPAGTSGISAATDTAAAVIVRVERINTTNTICLNASIGATINCNTGGNQENGTHAVPNGANFDLGKPTAGGYYRVTYAVRDNAGNVSANTVVTQLKDVTAPGSGAVVVPSVITGNASAAFSATVSDNLDLGDAATYVQYGPATASPLFIQDVAAPTGIGTYGPDTFTTSGTAATTFPNFMRSVQRGLTGAISRATTVTINVRDAAGVVTADPCPQTGNPNTTTPHCRSRRDDILVAVNAGIGASNSETNFSTVPGFTTFTTNAGATTVCNGTTQPAPSGQPCPTNPVSTTLTASATGPSATFTTSPFVRVNFYYSGGALTGGRHILIGTGTPTTTQDTGGNRTFNWSIAWTPTGLAPGAYQVFAIGVDSKGQGLLHNLTGPSVTVVVD